jgi:TRAP-type uncharacterized transport system substrate-binding protein
MSRVGPTWVNGTVRSRIYNYYLIVQKACEKIEKHNQNYSVNVQAAVGFRNNANRRQKDRGRSKCH